MAKKPPEKEKIVVEKEIDLNLDISVAADADGVTQERTPDLSANIPVASSVGSDESVVVERKADIQSSIPSAPSMGSDESVVVKKNVDISTDLPIAKSKESLGRERDVDISTDLPIARSKENIEQERGPADISTNLPVAQSKEAIERKTTPDIETRIPTAPSVGLEDNIVREPPIDISSEISPAPSLAFVNKTHALEGQWLPDLDEAEIGADNYKTLTNMRYGPAHPEGVNGYDQINNSVVLTNYFKMRSGHQLRTDRDTPSYVMTQVENTGETDSKVFLNTTAIGSQGSFKQVELHVSANAASDPHGNEADATTGWAGDGTGGTIASVNTDPSVGTYHFDIQEATNSIGEGAISDALSTVAFITNVIALDLKVISGSWTIDIRNSADDATIATLATEITDATYDSKEYTWLSAAADERIRITIDTAANGQIYVDNLSVRAKELFDDSDSAGLGRFSDAPSGNIGYCNQKESCIWAGDNMRTAAFYSVDDITTSPTDLQFAVGPPGTITTSGAINWQTIGFLPGQTITITACSESANIANFLIKDVTATVIEIAPIPTATGAGATATIIATIPKENPIDYTDSVNNELQSSDNVLFLGGGIDSFTKLMLHCDGTEGSATFTDSSDSAHTPGVNGNVHMTIAAKKFGTAAGIYGGAGDYLNVPDHADWFMDQGNFTIDFWVRWDAVGLGSTIETLFSQETGANDYIECYRIGSTWVRFDMVNGGSHEINVWGKLAGGGVLEANTWYHISVIRGWSGNADDWVLTVNGNTFIEERNANFDWPNYSGDFMIGYGQRAAGGASYHTGLIEEFRVSKGIARWTSEVFTPPSRQYISERLKWWTFSTRPLTAINYKIASANITASTTTVKTWDGSGLVSMALTDDGTSSGGASLAQDGAILFGSTVNISKPFHFEGLFLYAYLSELSAGDATIYNVNLNAPFQKIVDVWDGVYRQPVSFQVYDDTNKTYSDYTLEVNFDADSGTSIGGELNALATTEHVIVMFEEQMAAFYYKMYPGEENSNTAIPTLERWDGTQYVAVTITDETISDVENWESLGKTGVWSWNPPGVEEEVKQTLFGINGYAYRISFDGALSATVTVDRLFGIPAQKTVRPFAFPAMYRNQLMLFGYKEGKQANRVDYCLPNAPDVWNGDLSSNDGLQSLFFGGAEECVAAAQLFNRYGANIFSLLVVLKKNETYVLTGSSPFNYQIFTISLSLGCAAPLTITAAEVAFQVTSDVIRNIVIWVSHAGPVVFDGTVLSPLKGIESYFDPNHSNYITVASLSKAFGGYDSVRKEYNLLIPADSLWFVYDMIKRKWFLKNTGAAEFPKAWFPVIDTNGIQHVYGGIDNGYMIEQESGNVWEDGTSETITQTLETGDFFPTGNIWDLTRIHKFKMAMVKISEAGKNLAITHYADTGTSGSSLTALDTDSGSTRIVRATQRTNLLGWAHRFKYVMSTSTTDKGFQPIAWGYQYAVEREDE